MSCRVAAVSYFSTRATIAGERPSRVSPRCCGSLTCGARGAHLDDDYDENPDPGVARGRRRIGGESAGAGSAAEHGLCECQRRRPGRVALGRGEPDLPPVRRDGEGDNQRECRQRGTVRYLGWLPCLEN